MPVPSICSTVLSENSHLHVSYNIWISVFQKYIYQIHAMYSSWNWFNFLSSFNDKANARNRCGKIAANHRHVTVKKMAFGEMKSVVAVITMIGNSDSNHVENGDNMICSCDW